MMRFGYVTVVHEQVIETYIPLESFIVFSRNQYRRLLPAMCHNLRDGGRGPRSTGDCVYNTWPVAALTHAVKPDMGSESRFLPTPPAFDDHGRGGFPSKYRHPAVLYGKTRMVWLPDGEDIYSFWQNVRTWQTHGRTDTRTPHDIIGRACIALRGKNGCDWRCQKLHTGQENRDMIHSFTSTQPPKKLYWDDPTYSHYLWRVTNVWLTDRRTDNALVAIMRSGQLC